MSTERYIWLTFKAMSEAVAFINYRLMWKYLNQKALGMQTVFDQTLKVLIQSFLSLSLTSWLVFVKATEKYDETIALIITKCHYFIFIWTYLWALVFVLTRYVIIFHHEVMDNIEDSKYIKVRFLNLFPTIHDLSIQSNVSDFKIDGWIDLICCNND